MERTILPSISGGIRHLRAKLFVDSLLAKKSERPVQGRKLLSPALRASSVALIVILSLWSLSVVAAPTLSAQSATQTGAQTFWAPTTPYPNPVAAQSCVTYNGSIYCVGGLNETRAPSLGYVLLTGFFCAIGSSYIGSIGCKDLSGNMTGDAFYAKVNSSGVFDWNATTPYANGGLSTLGGSCVAYNGTIYCVGGFDNMANLTSTAGFLSFNATRSVYYANVSSSGIGQWRNATANPYPARVVGESCVVMTVLHRPFIYCVGGFTSVTSASSNVYYAPLFPNGVGAWTPTSALPGLGVVGQSCIGSNDTIYCVGGYNGGITFGSNASYYGNVGIGGISSWNPTTPYAGGNVTELSCVNSSGGIDCIGGLGVSLGAILSSPLPSCHSISCDLFAVMSILQYNSSTYFASINSTGIGSWNTTAPYGGGGIALQSCVSANVTIYCVGGVTHSDEITSGVYYTKVISPIIITQTQTVTRHRVSTSYDTVTSVSTTTKRPVTTTATETTTEAGPTSTISYTTTATQPLPTTGSITVFVYSPSGVPVSGVQISLTGSSTQTLTSDSNGKVTFTGLPLGGAFTVSATVSGAHLSATVTLTVSSNQATVVLEPSPASSLLYYGEIGGVLVILAILAVVILLLLRRRSTRSN